MESWIEERLAMAEPAYQIETDDDWSMSSRREEAVLQQVEAMSDVVEDRAIVTSRGKLTKAEIEALLRPDLPDTLDDEPGAAPPEAREFSAFEKTASSSSERDTEDARAIAAAISLGLRQECQLPAAANVVSIETGEFDSIFERGRQGAASLFFRSKEGQIAAALKLSSELTTSLIDFACGGEGAPDGVAGRALTAMDGQMLESILAPLAPSLGSGYQLARVEIDARFANAMAPPGTAEIVDLSVTLSGIEAPARLAVLHDASAATPQRIFEEVGPSIATAILTARIASLSVPVSKLSNLKPGMTLKLGIPADQPVELLSGGRDGILAAEGEIGRKGNAIAVRINRRGAYLRKARRKANQTL